MDDGACWFWLRELLTPLLSTELISAFIGAVLGGLFTMRATTRAHALEAAAQRNAERAVLYDTTRLIQVEISTAVQVFREEYGDELLQLADGTPYVAVLPIGANTFPIYDSSPACLSQLPPELSEILVRLYMRAKGLITMIENNNSDTERAQSLAEATLKERVAHMKGELTRQAADQLNKLYAQDVQSNAAFIGMGPVADGMKGVTREILDLLARANQLIDNLPRPEGR